MHQPDPQAEPWITDQSPGDRADAKHRNRDRLEAGNRTLGENDQADQRAGKQHAQRGDQQPEKALPMVTTVPARVLGLQNYGLQVGSPANLVILAATNWHNALQYKANKIVILRGKKVAITRQKSELYLDS